MEFKTKTFEDACALLKRSTALPDVTGLPEYEGKYLINEYKLITVTKAINQEANNGQPWQPDWNNSNQRKWFNWPWIKACEEQPAGFGFSISCCDCSYSYSNVGSRLYFFSREASEYAFENFNDLYLQHHLILS